MQLHAKVRAKSAARETGRREARKGGSPRRRDGAPAGASPRSQEDSPPQGGNPRRSAVRRSVPFGLSEGGRSEVGVPHAIKNRGDDARPDFGGHECSLRSFPRKRESRSYNLKPMLWPWVPLARGRAEEKLGANIFTDERNHHEILQQAGLPR